MNIALSTFYFTERGGLSAVWDYLREDSVETGARLSGTFGSYYPHWSLHHFHASCRKITESSETNIQSRESCI